MHPDVKHFIPSEFVRVLQAHRQRFFVTVAIVAGVVGVYAVGRPNTWEASQALIVRNEAAARSAQERPGKFDRPEQMQTLQETILELSRSRSVLEAALREVGPGTTSTAGWPAEADVDRLRAAVRVSPPKGSEFGKTEIFYLNVRDTDRTRAVQLASAMCRQLQKQYKELLDRKAHSMIDELNRAMGLAQDEVQSSTARLAKVETEVGSDLAELRILEKSPSGNSDLRTQLNTLETELRDAQQALQSNQELRKLLVNSTGDARQLLAAPNRLLTSQPALKRLKEGLIDAQLHSSQMRAFMSDEHPRVQAALAAEEEIRHNLLSELAIAIRGIDVELRLTSTRVDTLTAQLTNLHARLDKLATVRAQYGNLSEEIGHRQQILQTAETNLADARASQAAANSASLISLVDSPDTGSSPVGPGRLATLLAGVLGGAAIGLGVVLLSADPGQSIQNPALPIRPATSPEPEQTATGGLSLKQALSKLAQRRPLWN